jgi:hypothetical protein
LLGGRIGPLGTPDMTIEVRMLSPWPLGRIV